VGDFNVMRTELDVYEPERWKDDALFRVEVREAYKDLVDKDGQTRSGTFIWASGSTRSVIISERLR